MSAKARLEATITGNEQPFVAAVNRAEKHAQGFSGRLQSLFRRDPSRRAEHAISGFVGSLAAGDIGGAVAGISHKIGGLGLAIGVGLGAGVIIFEKFKEQVDATAKATKDLNAELARPLSLQSALGPEGIGSEIDKTAKKLDDLKEKRKGWFSQIQEAAFSGKLNYFKEQEDVNPSEAAPAAVAQQKAHERLKQLSEARATSELQLVNVRRTGMHVSEREAELQKIHLEADKKRAQLMLERGLTKPGRDVTQLVRSLAANQADEKLSKEQANHKADAIQRQYDLESEIVAIRGNGQSTEQQNLAILKATADEAERELRAAQGLNVEERNKATLKSATAAQALNDAQFKVFEKNPNAGSAMTTPADIEQKRLRTLFDYKNKYGEGGREIGNTMSKEDWNKRFPLAPKPNVFPIDETNDYYKNLMEQDTGDLMRGPMGTNRLGLPMTDLGLGMGVDPYQAQAMSNANAATGKKTDEPHVFPGETEAIKTAIKEGAKAGIKEAFSEE